MLKVPMTKALSPVLWNYGLPNVFDLQLPAALDDRGHSARTWDIWGVIIDHLEAYAIQMV